MQHLRFIDLFAGIGGFHQALSALGNDCVFASEIDDDLRSLYVENFPRLRSRTVGDITKNRERVPPHDILCAGFPCQPYSKSGYQDGHADARGKLFAEILAILRRHHPEYVLLENVGNFEQHAGGRTWAEAKASLQRLGYTVVATEHVKSGGQGLLSPHHLGFPQTRERFYAVCRRGPLSANVLPLPRRERITDIRPLLNNDSELTDDDREETRLSQSQCTAIEHWNSLHRALPLGIEFPSFPLWSDEFGAAYAYEETTPFAARKQQLLKWTRHVGGHANMTRRELIDLLPSYARENATHFPNWKVRFISQNRDWYRRQRRWFPPGWMQGVRRFPASLRKIEWNCKGEDHDLWSHVLQFRPSGLRVKRTHTIPALVALTTTQIPIIGPMRRYITRTEALRFQGFPDAHRLPADRELAFRALGNAVHVGVVAVIAAQLLGQDLPNEIRASQQPDNSVAQTAFAWAG